MVRTLMASSPTQAARSRGRSEHRPRLEESPRGDESLRVEESYSGEESSRGEESSSREESIYTGPRFDFSARIAENRKIGDRTFPKTGDKIQDPRGALAARKARV